jgi:hypothetical protein
VAEYDRVGCETRGAGGHPVQRLGPGHRAGQVQPAQRDAGVGGVHVGVDESRGDERPVEFDRLVGGRRVRGRAEPVDPTVGE